MWTIGLDPGTRESAVIVLEDGKLVQYFIEVNEGVVIWLETEENTVKHQLAIEFVQSYGMPVGKDIFETAYWSGVFAEAFGRERTFRHSRSKIKAYITGFSTGGDKEIRQALINRFGVVGTKKHPGPLHGIKADLWSALAVAVYQSDGAKLGGWKE